MSMTHYMELLSTNQPWHLILFMAIPVILAETIAVTELYVLCTRQYQGVPRTINRTCSILVGAYFVGVFLYLFVTAVLPLTSAGAWRGPADVIAVSFYLLGVIPLGALALIELKVIGGARDEHSRMALHAAFVAMFLVVAHVAMIVGMLDPALLMAGMSHPMS